MHVTHPFDGNIIILYFEQSSPLQNYDSEGQLFIKFKGQRKKQILPKVLLRKFKSAIQIGVLTILGKVTRCNDHSR